MVHERRSCLSFLPVDVVEKVESNQALCLCQKIVLDEHANDTASFELVRLGETPVECLRNLLEGLVWLLQDRQQIVQLLLRQHGRRMAGARHGLRAYTHLLLKPL